MKLSSVILALTLLVHVSVEGFFVSLGLLGLTGVTGIAGLKLYLAFRLLGAMTRGVKNAGIGLLSSEKTSGIFDKAGLFDKPFPYQRPLITDRTAVASYQEAPVRQVYVIPLTYPGLQVGSGMNMHPALQFKKSFESLKSRRSVKTATTGKQFTNGKSSSAQSMDVNTMGKLGDLLQSVFDSGFDLRLFEIIHELDENKCMDRFFCEVGANPKAYGSYGIRVGGFLKMLGFPNSTWFVKSYNDGRRKGSKVCGKSCARFNLKNIVQYVSDKEAEFLKDI